MSNLATNPWSFLQTDVVASAITSLTLNADGTVTAVVGSTTGIVAGNFVTVGDNTTAAGVYNWFYQVLAVVNATTLTLTPSFQQPAHIPAGTGAGGATGTLALNQYPNWVRAEDIKWDLVPPSATLDVRDRNGNPVWKASQPATAGSPPNYNRGKVFWINGLSLFSVGTAPAILFVTVN